MKLGKRVMAAFIAVSSIAAITAVTASAKPTLMEEWYYHAFNGTWLL
jgi:hypothetical protein